MSERSPGTEATQSQRMRDVAKVPWDRFTTCPFEDLRNPERVHVDPLGNVHICQGISLGNAFRSSLERICADYVPEAHPITGPLLAGGPAALTRHFGLPHDTAYADACHLCYETRRALRDRFPEILAPDQVYGELDARGASGRKAARGGAIETAGIDSDPFGDETGSAP